MELSISKSELKSYVGKQLECFFPDKYGFTGSDIDIALNLGLDRAEWCFKHITLPGYTQKGQAFFSHLHSDQYSQFLYYFSNSLWEKSQNKPICDKLILLNKALNGLFFSYKCKLPAIFLLGHPVGTIIGNAKYSDFLVIFQNVTINTNSDEKGNPAPEIGKGVFFAAGAKVIGNKTIGERTSIGVNTLVYDREIPSDSIAFTREDGNFLIVPRKKKCMAQNYFNVPIG